MIAVHHDAFDLHVSLNGDDEWEVFFNKEPLPSVTHKLLRDALSGAAMHFITRTGRSPLTS